MASRPFVALLTCLLGFTACEREQPAPAPAAGSSITISAMTADTERRLPLENVTVRLQQGGRTVAEQIVTGTHTFPGLATGTYRIEAAVATAPAGGTPPVTIEADVIPEAQTKVLFFLDPKNGLAAFKPAVAVADHRRNPDLTRDGVVNAADLTELRQCIDNKSSPCAIDLDGDSAAAGDTDVQVIVRAFERTTVAAPGAYVSQVTPGGTRVSVAGKTIMSDTGSTVVRVTPTDDPRYLRFVIQTDRGTAREAALGTFRFIEDMRQPSSGRLDLDTGELLDGQFTIRLVGGNIRDTVGVSAPFTHGQIVFAPFGFGLYHVVVSGTLPTGFPVFGQVAFTMAKCDPPAPEVTCAMDRIDPGDGGCPGGGFTCSSPGAACTVAGLAGVCTNDTVQVGGGLKRCRCVCR